MSRSVNRVILFGTVGRDPDVRQIADGTNIAHTSLATTRRVKDGDRVEDVTEWHRLTIRGGPIADVVEDYVRKGDRIYVEGRIEYDSFEKNGVTIPTVEIVVSEIVLTGMFGA